MATTVLKHMRAWLDRRSALLLLSVTASGLAGGGFAGLAGAGAAQDAVWLAAAAAGLGYALWATADSIRRGRIGVDVIAVLALAGAMAVGELLAAAVIGVMVASGRALEAWAAERAQRAAPGAGAELHPHYHRERAGGDQAAGEGA